MVKGEVDLCICPSESLISCWTSDSVTARPKAVAAVLADDTSAIVCLASSNITSLNQLDKQRYASYEGRFEMAIIKQMIINAGGKGDVIEINPPKLDCFDSVLRHEADSTWIFTGWEGLMAEQKNISLTSFPVSASGVPYGYSPLLLASNTLLQNPDVLKSFIEVTSRGFEHAVSNPGDATACLLLASKDESLTTLGVEFLTKSVTYLAAGGHYIDTTSNKWGMMTSSRWEEYVSWLLSNGLVTHRDGSPVSKAELPVSDLFTTDFL